jgi:hypothetical protein
MVPPVRVCVLCRPGFVDLYAVLIYTAFYSLLRGIGNLAESLLKLLRPFSCLPVVRKNSKTDKPI